MRRLPILLATLPALLATSPTPALAEDPAPFEWKDGDRVVLIGDALIEREQKYGYLETLITIQNPDKAITFRNLGWSGDTVRGVARAGFGKPEEGYRQLVQHVLALKPTVIFVGYGMTDSFAGIEGQRAFAEGLNRLLDDLSPLQARTILLSPIRHEDLGRPLPDPKMHNIDLGFYTVEIAKIARGRRLRFIDLFDPDKVGKLEIADGGLPPDPSPPLTDDGIHPNAFGYWKLAAVISRQLGCGDWDWHLTVNPYCRPLLRANGTAVKWLRRTGPEFCIECTDWALPVPPAPVKPDEFNWGGRIFLVEVDLPQAAYILKVDGKLVATGVSQDRARRGLEQSPLCFDLDEVPEYEQVEQLRRAIVEKNRLYFYRWRPQNETYLFGFRKHEQGNNAREIPLFDPLVEEQEKEIARLKVPVPHVYELVREGKGEG